MRAIDADALEKEGWSLHRTIRVDENTEEYQTKPLRKVPTIEAQQRWIPCSERLPEDGENVLVTYKTTDKIHLCQYHDDGSRNPWYSYIDQCRAHMNVVLAWMPLPEPYTEDKE